MLLFDQGGLQSLLGSIKDKDADKVSIGLASSLDTVAELELLQVLIIESTLHTFLQVQLSSLFNYLFDISVVNKQRRKILAMMPKAEFSSKKRNNIALDSYL